MPDHVRIVETRFVPRDEGTSRVLEHIAERAEKADERLNELSSTAGMMAGIGGGLLAGLSLERLSEEYNEFFESLKRIKTETGLTTQKAADLKEALEVGAGLGAGSSERLLLMMSRKAEAMQQAMNGAANGGGYMAREMKRLGIDLKKGPEASLLHMAELAEKGKISTGQISRTLGIRSTEAVSLMEMLEKGPEAIKEIEAGAMRVSAEDLAVFTRMQHTRREIKSTAETIMVAIAKGAMPSIEETMESVKTKLNEWSGQAQRFGEILGDHLEGALSTVTMIGKALVANYAIMKLTGRGAIGGGMKVLGWAFPEREGGRFFHTREAGDPRRAAVMKMTAATLFRTRSSTPMLDAWSAKQAPLSEKIHTRWTAIHAGASGVFLRAKDAFSTISPVVTGMLKLGGVAMAMLFAAGAARGILDAIEGKTTTAANRWRETFGYLEHLGVEADNIFGEDGTFMTFFANTAAWLALMAAKYSDETSTSAAEAMLARRQVGQSYGSQWKGLMWGTLATVGVGDYAERMRKALEDQQHMTTSIEAGDAVRLAERLAARKKKREEAEKKHDAPPYYDFRGSRFDILQRFEEGFDPDRIGVAFADDVAQLGERAVQSGFAPLFAVHG